MAVIIKATCATCGDAELDARSTRLTATAEQPSLGYRCPTCGWERLVVLNGEQHAALVAAGVAGFETLEGELAFLEEARSASRGQVPRRELDAALAALDAARTPADLFASG